MSDNLIEGFLKFREHTYEGHSALMPQLVREGQSPDYFIISCIDSRANPGTIFQAVPGLFFAHKAMGAIVRPYKKGTALAAALQFALNYNDVREIIVLGHTGCGAVHALIDNIEDEEIASFVEVAREGLHKAEELAGNMSDHNDLHRHAEEQIVLLSVRNLREYPSVKAALQKNKVILRPWLFDMTTGDLLEYEEKSGNFVSLLNTLGLNGDQEAKTSNQGLNNV
jgi:carbonic anhydrase